MNIEGLDETDNKIIEILQENARLSYSDIGKKIGVSRVTVKNRMDDMEDRGVIKGYKVIISPEEAVSGIKFFAELQVKHDYFDRIIDRLKGEKIVKEVYIVSGDCKIMVVGISSNIPNIQTFVRNLYKADNGIARINLNIAMSVEKERIDYGREIK